MEEENCKLHQGYVYKFIPESTKTYTYYKPVKDFVMRLLGDPLVADVVANHVYEVSRLLAEKSCRVIKQLKLDYNFIEVIGGIFFNIEKKCFEEHPVLDGSPRAFVLHKRTKKVPQPKPFIEGK